MPRSCRRRRPRATSKSSTFKQGDRIETLPFATGVGVDPVVNNDYVLTVQSATDSVTVGNITLKNVSLFTIVNQTEPFNIDPFLGIQGMGSSAEGFFAALIRDGLDCESTCKKLVDSLCANDSTLSQPSSACS